MNITTNEILDALRAALEPAPGNDGEFSVAELAEAMHCSRDRVRAALAVMVRERRVVSSHGARIGIDGVNRHTPVYRLVSQP